VAFWLRVEQNRGAILGRRSACGQPREHRRSLCAVMADRDAAVTERRAAGALRPGVPSSNV